MGWLVSLFTVGDKAKNVLTIFTHLVALILGIIVGMAFAKPTIIINRDENKPHNQRDEDNGGVIWGGSVDKEDGSLPSSSSPST